MRGRLRLLILASAISAPCVDAQEVTGLLTRGRVIAFPQAVVPSFTPIATAEFRLEADTAGRRRAGWSVGALRDELDRVGTRASIRAPVGSLVAHATFERAAVRNLEEITDFERTGAHVAAHDGRLEAGVVSVPARGFWGATSARYSESRLADRRTGSGELLLGAGWRNRHGLQGAIEAAVVSAASSSASAETKSPWVRAAVMTSPLPGGVRIGGGAIVREAGTGQGAVSTAAALRWSGWQNRVTAAAGGEWGHAGLADAALEVAVAAGRFTLGTRVSRQAPGMSGVSIWLGSGLAPTD